MPTFREQLRALQARPGVLAVVATGRDGLLIDATPGAPDAEHLAALAPALVTAAETLAAADAAGEVRSVVVEGARGLMVALPVGGDVTVLALIDATHGDAGPAIGAVRAERAALAAAL